MSRLIHENERLKRELWRKKARSWGLIWQSPNSKTKTLKCLTNCMRPKNRGKMTTKEIDEKTLRERHHRVKWFRKRRWRRKEEDGETGEVTEEKDEGKSSEFSSGNKTDDQEYDPEVVSSNSESPANVSESPQNRTRKSTFSNYQTATSSPGSGKKKKVTPLPGPTNTEPKKRKTDTNGQRSYAKSLQKKIPWAARFGTNSMSNLPKTTKRRVQIQNTSKTHHGASCSSVPGERTGKDTRYCRVPRE